VTEFRFEKLEHDLESRGVSEADREKVKEALVANLPARTYNAAVVYLGIATVALVLGSILLGGLNKEVPEALWGALGAGIGGLAGIFMGKQ